ncbi:MAG: SDR family NAD(P)-dependent oxidoreductase [Pseudomonadota bacterium]
MSMYKVAAVTGGASGIGKAFCERLTRDGCRVAVLDLDGDGAARLADELGGIALRCDVGNEAEMTAAIDRVEEELGPVDLFVANAGILSGDGPDGAADAKGLWAAFDDRWETGWQVNVMAHVYAARALVPRMIERGGGTFVSVASAAGLLAQIGDAMYSVTKHAAVGFAESLAITHGDDGIKVTLVCPQAVDTPMVAAAAEHREESGNAIGGAAVDGIVAPETVADMAIAAALEGRFLVLPHPGVAGYMQAKAADYDRWISGMRAFRRKLREST